jgi:subtilisin family serine protease
MNTRRFSRLPLVALAASVVVATLAIAGPADARTTSGYVVVLRDEADAQAVAGEHANAHRFSVSHVYTSALSGYAATMSEQVAGRLKSDPRVLFLSPDLRIQASPTFEPADISFPGGCLPYYLCQAAPRGVRRIGASTDGLTQTLANNGDGIGVAVIDTGIQLNHPDLAPVTGAKSCVSYTLSADDDAGHGTHVAGTIAARDNSFGVVGVAPGANLYAVKVLDQYGGGYLSTAICGVDWVTANAASKGIRVANMSLGSFGSATPSNADCTNGNNDALHKAICKSVKAGVTYVVSAGNYAMDASSFVPAAYDEVITVSAWSDTNGLVDATGAAVECKNHNGTVLSVESDETWATFTNYGPVVDIAAPGVGIVSTYKDSGYRTMCGTSMAAPHVTGVAALALKNSPGLTPFLVKIVLMSGASALPDSPQHTENLVNASNY